MSKCLVLLSGGADSACLLYKAVKEFDQTEAILFLYGQRTERQERQAAEALVDRTGTPLFVYRIPPGIFQSKSIMMDDKASVPEGANSGDNLKSVVVPNRNVVFLSLAYAYAVAIDATAVGFANHAGFSGLYFPDCSPEFTASFVHMQHIALSMTPKLWRPFQAWKRAEVYAEGQRLGVPFELTWSCYNDGDTPCGKCGACIDRLKAGLPS